MLRGSTWPRPCQLRRSRPSNNARNDDSGAVNDGLAVQPDPRPLPELHDTKAVPLAERLVRLYQRISSGGARSIVEEAAGSELRAPVPFAASLGRIPDLDLRVAAEIDAAVGLGDGSVLEPELDVTELLVARGVRALAVVDEFASFDAPVLLEFGLALLSGPRLAGGIHHPDAPRVDVAPAVPAAKIPSIEQRTERRLRRYRRKGRLSRRRERSGTERD